MEIFFIGELEYKTISFESGFNILTSQNFDDKLYRKLCHLNESRSYVVSTSHWKFIDMCQYYLTRKKFELTDICFNITSSDDEEHLTFYYNSIFLPKSYIRDLETFTLFVYQSGLMKIWNFLSYMEIRELGFFEYIQDKKDERVPLNLKFFEVCWWILIIGWIVSLKAFFIEIYRKNLSRVIQKSFENVQKILKCIQRYLRLLIRQTYAIKKFWNQLFWI